MFQRLREFLTGLVPPYEDRDYMTRRMEIEMARMRLRDEFAMAALTGLLQQGYDRFNPDEWSNQAYAYADAMLEARETDK